MLFKKLINLLKILGVDLRQFYFSTINLPKFYKDHRAFSKAASANDYGFPIKKYYPMLTDHLDSSGVATGHYFHQDLFVARRIFQADPVKHIDIGSRIDGFIAHLAVFRSVDVGDIRPLTTSTENIKFIQCDIMDTSIPSRVGIYDSVSCLHSIEHFGLGRYGDPIMVDGHEIALKNLGKLVATGGTLYVSVPIGDQRVEFNGHRVFQTDTISNFLADEFALEHFSFIDDEGEFHEHVSFEERQVAENFGCNFGCGIYEFKKHKSANEVN